MEQSVQVQQNIDASLPRRQDLFRRQHLLRRRQNLLEKIVDTLLAGGVSSLSLLPLARSAGTSARLLIDHFGSRQELPAAALQTVRT